MIKDQINLFLVDEAKSMLLNPNLSISETAYQLGFEYPQYLNVNHQYLNINFQ